MEQHIKVIPRQIKLKIASGANEEKRRKMFEQIKASFARDAEEDARIISVLDGHSLEENAPKVPLPEGVTPKELETAITNISQQALARVAISESGGFPGTTPH